jgi:hypothetical protein
MAQIATALALVLQLCLLVLGMAACRCFCLPACLRDGCLSLFLRALLVLGMAACRSSCLICLSVSQFILIVPVSRSV